MSCVWDQSALPSWSGRTHWCSIGKILKFLKNNLKKKKIEIWIFFNFSIRPIFNLSHFQFVPFTAVYCCGPIFNLSNFQFIQFSICIIFNLSNFQFVQFSLCPIFNSAIFNSAVFNFHSCFIPKSLVFHW